MNISDLKNLLKTSEVTVSFVKRDGTTRIMKCTLKPDVVPQVFGSSAVPKNEQHIIVFDTEKEAWRTLNLENPWSIKV